MNPDRKKLESAKLIVVKVGSQLLTCADGYPDHAMIHRLADEIAKVKQQGRSVVLVSSGAIAFGRRALHWDREVKTIAESQMLASVGQARLIHAHSEALAQREIEVGQVLLTHRDISDRLAYLNVHNTLRALLDQGVVPILNENDAVGYEEIRFGDNDELAALVSSLMEADLMVLLTEPDGVFNADPSKEPEATRIESLRASTDEGASMSEIDLSGKSAHGRGGMSSKLQAAAIATKSGIPVVIASGRKDHPITSILRGEDVGTLCPAEEVPLEKRRHWVRYGLKCQGALHLDEGASRAVKARGASVLPVGVVSVSGSFQRGEAVEVIDSVGRVIARGLAAYPAAELSKICGVQSAEIEQILGYRYMDVAVHRDDLILETFD